MFVCDIGSYRSHDTETWLFTYRTLTYELFIELFILLWGSSSWLSLRAVRLAKFLLITISLDFQEPSSRILLKMIVLLTFRDCCEWLFIAHSHFTWKVQTAIIHIKNMNFSIFQLCHLSPARLIDFKNYIHIVLSSFFVI